MPNDTPVTAARSRLAERRHAGAPGSGTTFHQGGLRRYLTPGLSGPGGCFVCVSWCIPVGQTIHHRGSVIDHHCLQRASLGRIVWEFNCEPLEDPPVAMTGSLLVTASS